MIFTSETANLQIQQLLKHYPELCVVESNETIVRLHGNILVHRVFNDFPVRKTYLIDICIPVNSDDLPYIIDVNNYIDQSYHHIYPDGKLCLETDSKIRIYFINGFNLVTWMKEFVEPYFFSYEYYKIYGIFPLGERQHGYIGTIETYQDYFNTKEPIETYKIMFHIRNNAYRGHHICPCESGKNIRNCHGKWMLPFYKDARKREIMVNDLIAIERVCNDSKKYYRKAK